MTRINCVPVEELTDKHLIAEYRELPRVFALARLPNLPEIISWPPQYTLGKGHVKFFYNKLGYCFKRQCALVQEMIRRGFKPSYDPLDLLTWHNEKEGLWKDWIPTPEAIEINRQRIKERLK